MKFSITEIEGQPAPRAPNKFSIEEVENPQPREAVIQAPQSEWADRGYGVAQLAGMGGSALDAAGAFFQPGAPNMHYGDTAREGVANLLGVEEPSTLEGEARAQSIAGLGLVAGTFPFVGPVPASIETILAMVAPFLNKHLQDKMRETSKSDLVREGVGAAGEIGATIAGGGAAFAVPKLANRAKSAYKAFIASPEIIQLAKSIGVKPKHLFEAIPDVKRWFPKSPDGSESIIGEAADRMEAVVKEFPDPMKRPRTLQAADNDIARENLSNAEQAVGDMPGSQNEWLPEIEGKQVALEKEMQRKYDEELLFEGSAPGLSESYKEGAGNVKERTRGTWTGPGGADEAMDLYEFPADLTQNKAQEIIDAAEYGTVPKLITRLAGEEETLVHSHRQIQSMMSELKGVARAAARDPERAGEGRWANEMIDHLRGLEDSIPNKKVKAKLATARASTKTQKELLQPTPANKALATKDQVREMGAKVVNSRDDARRAMEVLGTTEDGVQNLRSVVTEKIWGGDLFDKATRPSPRSIIKNIKKYRDGLEEVFGLEHVDRMEELARVFEMVERGRMGTVGAIRGAGSGKKNAAAMLGLAQDATNPSMLGKKALAKLAKGIENSPQRTRIFQEFFKDPEFAARLLRDPTPRGKAAWVLGWKQLMARAGARQGAVRASDK